MRGKAVRPGRPVPSPGAGVGVSADRRREDLEQLSESGDGAGQGAPASGTLLGGTSRETGTLKAEALVSVLLDMECTPIITEGPRT